MFEKSDDLPISESDRLDDTEFIMKLNEIREKYARQKISKKEVLLLLGKIVAYAESEPLAQEEKMKASLSEKVETLKIASDIFVNMVVVVGGVMGISYIWRAREKQKEAIFGYLTKLNIRLIELRKTLLDFKAEIMDCFGPADYMREIPGDRIRLIKDVIENFSSEASETLQFIKKEDSQFPAQKGWSKKIEKLVGFLVDCERIQYKAYFCVSGENSGKVDEAKEKYYKDALDNIDDLIKMVGERQEELEKKLFENLFDKIKRLIDTNGDGEN